MLGMEIAGVGEGTNLLGRWFESTEIIEN
uniref:Uncharacterized protein n=1 Tax=Rhizophora mucronata TaxID=61149 RepID=A0A2P2NIL9_RHIMU